MRPSYDFRVRGNISQTCLYLTLIHNLIVFRIWLSGCFKHLLVARYFIGALHLFSSFVFMITLEVNIYYLFFIAMELEDQGNQVIYPRPHCCLLVVITSNSGLFDTRVHLCQPAIVSLYNFLKMSLYIRIMTC